MNDGFVEIPPWYRTRALCENVFSFSFPQVINQRTTAIPLQQATPESHRGRGIKILTPGEHWAKSLDYKELEHINEVEIVTKSCVGASVLVARCKLFWALGLPATTLKFYWPCALERAHHSHYKLWSAFERRSHKAAHAPRLVLYNKEALLCGRTMAALASSLCSM